jgi:hypothetical protein
LSDALCKTTLATAHVSSIGRCFQYPLHGRPASLSLAQRHWDLQGNATTSSALLASDAHERRNRVNCKCQVENRVER